MAENHSAGAKKPLRFNCPHREKCGACTLGALDYAQQCREKEKRLIRLLGSFGRVEPILAMENPYYYRGKVHAVIAQDRQGRPISGVYARGTHHVIDVHDCLLEDKRASRIIATLTQLLEKSRVRIYNEHTHRGALRHVVIRTAQATGQIMVTLVTAAEDLASGDDLIRRLLEKHPEITTVIQNINPRQTSVVLGTKERVLFGPGYIEDELCGCRFRLSSRSFYQVNRRQTEVLYRTAIGLAGLTGEEHILDAYCGTGTIGLCAAGKAKSLTGVELNHAAVEDAKINADLNHIGNARFICADAGRFLVKEAEKGFRADVVFMDPPREGSSEDFLRALLQVSPKKIVYVSCGPETLARDLKVLTEGGYRCERMVPVDMFPCTEHVETVILLSQQKSDDTIRVGIDLKPEDVTVAERKATYAELQAYIEEKYGFKVSNLYIAQAKAAMGIKERENYNQPRKTKGKTLVCPPEKMKAIQEALRHFKMI